MDHYNSSRSQKKQSPSHSSNHSSSSKHSLSATTKSTSSRSFTAIANSSQPYESPYAQNRDKISQPPSDTSYRTSSRPESDYPTLSVPSPLPTSRSPYSSSSDGSLYISTPAPQQPNRNALGKMSSSRTMSAVSNILYLSSNSGRCSFSYILPSCLHYPSTQYHIAATLTFVRFSLSEV